VGDAAGVLFTVDTSEADAETAADGVAVAGDDVTEEGLTTAAELLDVVWSAATDDDFVLEQPAIAMTTAAPINGAAARLTPITNPSQKICS
jgi:hypothetical protein